MSDDLARVFERVEKEIHKLRTPCWLWTGSDSGNGYGRISINGKTRAVHIFVWEHFNGPVPEGKVLDHECRNRHCCNPEHLTPRSVRDNTLRGIGPTAKNAAKTHCKRGHELYGHNLIVRKRNGREHRECRECKNERARKKRAVVPSEHDSPRPSLEDRRSAACK